MSKLIFMDDRFIINSTRQYRKISVFPEKIINKCFDFAYNMSFANKGQHRRYRSGGSKVRKNGEIFINAFQGKLSEFGVWNEFVKRKIYIANPDLREYKLGEWDNFDFKVGEFNIAVKSTKSYGNLLLLEKKDWNDRGEYIPNKEKGTSLIDYFILIRIDPSGEDIMKKNRLLYSDNINKNELYEIISSNDWSYDIAGICTHDDICEIIKNKQIIYKDSFLNHTKMDADNYYVQSGDMKDIEYIFNDIYA